MMADHLGQNNVNDASFTRGLPEHICLHVISQTKTLSVRRPPKIDVSTGSRHLPTGPSFISEMVGEICQMQHFKKYVTAEHEYHMYITACRYFSPLLTQSAVRKQCMCC
uniref:PPUP9154 n=1 Tax=Poeciliopsis prolifica TaxID=188132 RepID=A0A0S7ESR3_9TELE